MQAKSVSPTSTEMQDPVRLVMEGAGQLLNHLDVGMLGTTGIALSTCINKNLSPDPRCSEKFIRQLDSDPLSSPVSCGSRRPART